MAKPSPTKEIIIGEDGYVLRPNVLYLGRTNENTKTYGFVPLLSENDDLAALGMEIHVTAGFGDNGFEGTWTLEIMCTNPIRVYPNTEIGRLQYFPLIGDPSIEYRGKYFCQVAAGESRLSEEYTPNTEKTVISTNNEMERQKSLRNIVVKEPEKNLNGSSLFCDDTCGFGESQSCEEYAFNEKKGALLTNEEIKRQMSLGNIVIKDAKPNPLQKPNSFDVRLGDCLYTYDYDILDVRDGKGYLQEALTGNLNALRKEKIKESGTLLQPYKVYLARTIESVETHGFVPIMYGKTGLSLLGVSVELTNGYKTNNFSGHLLLCIIATKPTRIYPGIDIANLTFCPSINESLGIRQINEKASCGLYAGGMLSGNEIKRRMLGENPDIVIEKQDLVVFNPNSVNLTLNNTLGVYTEPVLDMKEKNPIEIQIEEGGIVLYPDEIYVGRTNEWTETQNIIPMLSGRSSLGRNGIHVHCSAGLGSIGYRGYWHLGIRVLKPIRVERNMKCCQLYYLNPEGEVGDTYKGFMQDLPKNELGSQMHLILRKDNERQ